MKYHLSPKQTVKIFPKLKKKGKPQGTRNNQLQARAEVSSPVELWGKPFIPTVELVRLGILPYSPQRCQDSFIQQNVNTYA